MRVCTVTVGTPPALCSIMIIVKILLLLRTIKKINKKKQIYRKKEKKKKKTRNTVSTAHIMIPPLPHVLYGKVLVLLWATPKSFE